MSESDLLFAKRRKLLTVKHDAQEVALRIRERLSPERSGELRELLDQQHPADLADAMFFLSEAEDIALFQHLDIAEAAVVLDEVDGSTEDHLIRAISPERLASILENLPYDEATDVVNRLSKEETEAVLALTDTRTAAGIRTLLAYAKDTAGGVMATGFVAVPEAATQTEAVELFRASVAAEPVFYIFIVDAEGVLRGSVDLRRLFSARPQTTMREIMQPDLITVTPECDQEQVASIFSRYDLMVLPVVASGDKSRLIGIITADDIIDVIQEENNEDVARLVGSDAQELENKTPVQVARLRLPWIMTTMFIELLAGFVIKHYDATLTKYILLASFMPIISAISGNTGLQSAAIIIRGLSSGQVQLTHWQHALKRQVVTTLLLGGACALVLAVVAGIWDRHWAFAVVVFLGMFASINIAGVVGTVVPMLSKRAGFDPALTAGPFETAFQDVIGISIFLSLASVMLNWFH